MHRGQQRTAERDLTISRMQGPAFNSMAKRRKIEGGPGKASLATVPPPSTPGPDRETTSFLLPNGYTFGIGWKPVPPWVENLHVELSALLVDSTVDWAEEALKIAQKEERKEPGSSFPPNHSRVIVRTALARIGFMSVGSVDRYPDGRHVENKAPGAPTYFRFPDATFEVRFSESDQLVRLDRLFTTAERVRNYLAFNAMMQLPVAAVMSSRGFLWPEKMDCDPRSYAPPHAPRDEGEFRSWCRMYDDIYAGTKRLITRVHPDGPLGRAISLVGESIWSRDHEERFFYAWRALEVVGNLDLSTARRQFKSGDKDALKSYLSYGADALSQSQPVRIEALAKVTVSLGRRAPAVPTNQVEAFYELRNAIAHGDVSAEQHARILKTAPELITLAKQVVNQLAIESLPGEAEGSGPAEQ